MSLKISAAILVRNEEKNIRYCLKTIAWCDEIVVVDMESRDRTTEIALEFTDKILSHKITPAFDIAKKMAVDAATGDWILLIDADEMIPEALAITLKQLADKDTTDIVFIPRKNYIMGDWVQHTLWWPDYQPRFFKKDAISITETIHAYANFTDTSRKLYLPATEDNSMYHFAYRDSEHFIQKLNRYTSIEAQHMFDKKTKFSLCRMLYAAMNEFFLRYIRASGFKDGYHGFFLSVMMAFYRALSHIKLWEKWKYPNESVIVQYNQLRDELIKQIRCEQQEDRHH